MNNSLIITGELVTSVGVSSIVSNAISAEPLLTALITFGVSIVTLVGGELIKFLIAFLQRKTNEQKRKDVEDGKEEGKEEK